LKFSATYIDGNTIAVAVTAASDLERMASIATKPANSSHGIKIAYVVGGWRFDGRPYGREGVALLVAVPRPADCYARAVVA
jgi:hypothetical protein